MFVVVNFDALAQASDFRIERRQVVFLCWMQDSKLESLETTNRQQTECQQNSNSQTDWALEDQAKTWTQQSVPMMSEHSAHLTLLLFGFHTWLWQYPYSLLILMLWHRQAIFLIERRQVVLLCWMQVLRLGSLETPNRRQTECPLTNRLSYQGSSQNFNSTVRPYDEWTFSPHDFTAVWLSAYIYAYIVGYTIYSIYTYMHTYLLILWDILYMHIHICMFNLMPAVTQQPPALPALNGGTSLVTLGAIFHGQAIRDLWSTAAQSNKWLVIG